MSRSLGVLLLVLLLLGSVGLRLLESRRADALLDGEAHARASIGALARASLAISQQGRSHPGLRGALLDAAPGLEALPDLGTEELSYARDGVYMYGLATRSHRDSPTGPLLQGWVLRAWPLRFGVTGDAEYHMSEDGRLWEGSNHLGRSGTAAAFPPPFPDPGIGQPRAAWWPVPLPDHM